MVDFPPLAPSAKWMACFFESLKENNSLSEAILLANKTVSPKEFGRFTLLKDSRNETVMSVAVEGGGRQLRSFDNLDGLNLSEHGNWRKTHLGALESSLGKTPFFRFFQKPLFEVYDNLSITSLKDFNSAIFRVLYAFIMGNMKPENLCCFNSKDSVAERGTELARKLHEDMSSFEVLANYGKEALLGFLAMKDRGLSKNN